MARTLLQHLKEGTLSPTELVGAIAQGGAKEDQRYDLATLRDTLSPLLNSSCTISEVDMAGSDVYIVKIDLPDSNLQYHTIMVGGKVVISRGEEGELSLAEPDTAVSDLVDILAHAAVFSGQAKTTAKHTRSGPKGKKGQSTPKPKPGVMIDKALIKYFETNATFLAFGYLDSSADTTELTFSGPDGLEQIVDDPSFLNFASGRDVKVEARTIAAHLRKLRSKISRRVRVYHSELSENPLIRRAAIEISQRYCGKGPNKQFPDLEQLCSDVDIVRDLYLDFAKIKDRDASENPIEHYLIGLREFSLTVLHEQLEDSPEKIKDLISSTGKWIAYAKAADYISQDPYVANEIIPLLEESEAEPEEESKQPSEQDLTHMDRAFLAISKTGKRVIDPNKETYDPLFLRMVVRGMWMKGLLKNQSGEMLGGVSAYTEYTNGFGHYLSRRGVYEPLLDATFDRLNAAGEIDQNTNLSSRLECERLGNQLYDSLEPNQQAQFRRLLSPIFPLKKGSYLGRILRWHVGLKREEYASKLTPEESET